MHAKTQRPIPSRASASDICWRGSDQRRKEIMTTGSMMIVSLTGSRLRHDAKTVADVIVEPSSCARLAVESHRQAPSPRQNDGFMLNYLISQAIHHTPIFQIQAVTEASTTYIPIRITPQVNEEVCTYSRQTWNNQLRSLAEKKK